MGGGGWGITSSKPAGDTQQDHISKNKMLGKGEKERSWEANYLTYWEETGACVFSAFPCLLLKRLRGLGCDRNGYLRENRGDRSVVKVLAMKSKDVFRK